MIQLNQREKYAVLAACGVLVIFVVLQLLVFPLMDKQERLERMVQVKTDTLNRISKLAADFEMEKQQASAFNQLMAERQKGFSLFSFLDRLAGNAGIKDRVVYMKPSVGGGGDSGYKISKVEVKLGGIGLGQLVSFLHAVETSKNSVAVSRISISHGDKKENGLDTLILFETFSL